MMDKRQPDEMDMDLMDALFGSGSMLPENYLKLNEELRGEQVQTDEESDRAAEFEQMMADADVTSIENDTSVVKWAGRLRAGQFHSRVKEWFSLELADLAYDSLICTASFARQNAACWQSLKQLQSSAPALYGAVVSKIAWERGGVIDLGPFGNDWGE